MTQTPVKDHKRMCEKLAPDLKMIDKKKRICKIVDLDIPADYIFNLKEMEKKDKYLC